MFLLFVTLGTLGTGTTQMKLALFGITVIIELIVQSISVLSVYLYTICTSVYLSVCYVQKVSYFCLPRKVLLVTLVMIIVYISLNL